MSLLSRDDGTARTVRGLGAALAFGVALAGAQAIAACDAGGRSRAALFEIRDAGFEIEDAAQRNAFARALTACLDDPDPEIRDGVAYAGLATLLRGNALEPDTLRSLNETLSAMLAAADEDGDGFRRPFAALALSEVVRADRVAPILTGEERDAIVTLAIDYMRGIRDYRGFSDGEGWRHGVAHAADLLMQLVLNPQVDDDAIAGIVDAALSQVSPPGGHAYVHGESARLARPVLFAARRDVIGDEAWASRFTRLANPAAGDWAVNFGSEAGLAELHNKRAFLLSVYAGVAEASDPQRGGLRAAARSALASLP
jgi:hypothetical protein